MGGDLATGRFRQPDIRRFGDEIPDGQDQSVRTDDDAITDSLRTQDAGGEGIFGNDRAQFDERAAEHLRLEGSRWSLR